jgi:cyclic pyranopterin phosphate synthase
MPAEGISQLTPNSQLLTLQEISRLARLFVHEGVTKVRLTGGEPMVRRDLSEVITALDQLRSEGLRKILMTTNGLLLKSKSHILDQLDGVNISLDTLDEHTFTLLTRRQGFNRVLEGIELARQRLHDVKINCVVIRGVNDHSCAEFIERFLPRDHEVSDQLKLGDVSVRFIEYMPFNGNAWEWKKCVPYQELLTRLKNDLNEELMPITTSKDDTTKYFGVPGRRGRVGFITSMSQHFCSGCTRLRITADGNLKVCLFGRTETSLRDMLRTSSDTEAGNQMVLDLIAKAVKKKKFSHDGMQVKDIALNGIQRPMILIGG